MTVSHKSLIDDEKLVSEWNLEKNKNAIPSEYALSSHKKVWWKCIRGHEWLAAISDRRSGTGCPYCSGNKVLIGYNDLNTVNSVLANEWNYEKNNGLTPENVTTGSQKKVWWKCNKGHEWEAKISHRTNGGGCPYCSGKKVLEGFNDLSTVNPNLAKEWNYEKNENTNPKNFTASSGKSVWWKCSKNHEWRAIIANRNNGIGCPFCNIVRQTSFPEYALEYYIKKYGFEVLHTYRNKGYELDIYIPLKKTAIEYDGHFWHHDKATKDLEKNQKCQFDGIKLYRIREGLSSLNDTSIDYIVDKNQKNLSKIIKQVLSEILETPVDVDLNRDFISIENLREYSEKENSLLFSNTQLSTEWHYEKNGSLKPENVTIKSNKKVWWRCSVGHEWQAIISDRYSGTGCPYCSGRYVVKGESDLLTINPELAGQWNYERNDGLNPEDVMAGSHKRVWWKCSKGHEWQSIIKHRNNGSGCPYCSGRYAINGENDLQTLNPTLASEWDYKRNIGLTPMNVKPNSGKTVFWKCRNDHSWKARIADRNKGMGCPYCSGRKKLQ